MIDTGSSRLGLAALLLGLTLCASAQYRRESPQYIFSNTPTKVIGFGSIDVSSLFIWTADTGYTDTQAFNTDYVYLPTLGLSTITNVNFPLAINKQGNVVVGISNYHAVFWKNGKVTNIEPAIDATHTVTSSSSDLVSNNGTVIVGSVFSDNGHPENNDYWVYRSFRWTPHGTSILPSLDESANPQEVYAIAMNPDGRVIIGAVAPAKHRSQHAVMWVNDTITDLHPADIDDTGSSIPVAVSTDGNVIALNAAYDNNQAYRWTQGEGAVSLGKLGNGTRSLAEAMNSTGSVIVGSAWIDTNNTTKHAFRWSETGGMEDLHSSNLHGNESFAYLVSKDGEVVGGSQYTISHSNGSLLIGRAFRWTRATGSVDLGGFGANEVYAYAMTPDGRVIVGQGLETIGPALVPRGFRWNEKDGMQTVNQWLSDSGVTLLDSIHIASAVAVSDDGSIVAGYLDNQKIFIARGNSGLMTVEDATKSVSQTQAAVGSIRTSSSLVLSGSHGHPLARRAEAGHFISWAGGDYGSDDHGSRDGSVGIAEAGGGYNFGLSQLNVALGRTDSTQNTDLNGAIDHTGTFVIVDLITPLPDIPLTLTLTGIYQWSLLDVRRGYFNAGLPDISNGNTDARTMGGAVRVDWENAGSLFQAIFAPYIKFVITQSAIDSFTETTGGFPAAYSKQTDTISDLHLGTNAVYALRQDLRLIATVEFSHRFQDASSAGSVSIPGVTNGFTSMAGDDYTQNWLSGGLGTDYDIGAGTFSVMVNVTTESPVSSLWLATSYQFKF